MPRGMTCSLVRLLVLLPALWAIPAGCSEAGSEHEGDARERAGGAPSDASGAAGDQAGSVPDRAAVEAEPFDLRTLIRHGEKHARPRTAGMIRLATYNVENLFDEIDDPSLSERYEDIDDALPFERRQPLSDAIRAIDADILCVQEIESEGALRWFMDGYLAGMGYDYVVSIDAGDERGIEQAVLSRFPIVESRNWVRRPLGGVHPDKWGDAENWHAGEAITFHRSPMMVEVEIPTAYTGASEDYRLTLFVVHQKSGGPGAYWRERESEGLVEIIGEIAQSDPARNIAILGDFNATSDQQSVRTYLDAGFGDVFAGRTGAEVITHATDRRIDMIFVNDALSSEVDAESAFVLGTVQRLPGMSWREPAPPGYASDHYPVVVDLWAENR